MKKYTVTVWKTESYRVQIEVEANTESEAEGFAVDEVMEDDEIVWTYVDSEFDVTRIEEVLKNIDANR